MPVLVEGISMPTPASLPPSMVELSFRNAVHVRVDPDFSGDVTRLIEQIRCEASGLPKSSAMLPAKPRQKQSEVFRCTGGWPKARHHSRSFSSGDPILSHTVVVEEQSRPASCCRWTSRVGGPSLEILTVDVVCDEGDVFAPDKHWIRLKVVWET